MFEILGITFHWYGLLVGLGIWVAMKLALNNRNKIPSNDLEKAMWYAVIGGVIGARIYHVIDFWGRYYSTDVIKVFYLWEGGLAIWGAIVGGVIGLLSYCYFNKLNFLEYFDVCINGLPLAQAIGRIGNYANGELYGKKGEPLYAYEAALNLILFFVMNKIPLRYKKRGVVSGVYLVGYGIIRIVLENFRPEENIWSLSGIPVAILFSIAAISVGSFLIFRRKQS
ncbi:MAG TPA: prolipoprotein diacylglyceryl transferase [Spirochaetia bacterium]|nr:prolipoprotein diacylglyceryl transferase [Spirochaetia bacterium]